jgi:3-hydroxy-9,10-secoandrosta-1,3,5(10)-triene-9,17-dione monooxygenase
VSSAAAQSRQALVASARELAPRLAARHSQADALRRLPDQTIADMQRAGFFRILQPQRWGGLELDPQTFFDVQIEIARACASTAWVLGVVGAHAWQLALFDERAQREVWAADSRTLISSSYAPTGSVERVEGGYKLHGRWSFSSGSDHCQWVFLGGFAPPIAEGKPPAMLTFLLPRSDYRIEDTWHTVGLRGTGSNDIVVEGAFVPEYRTHKMMDGFRGTSPGNAVNSAALYKLPFGQLFVRSVSTTSIGIAEAALESFLAAASKRVGAGDGAKVAIDPQVQRVAAEAAIAVDHLKLVLQRNIASLQGFAERGEQAPVALRVRYRYESAHAADSCAKLVSTLFNACGGRAIFLGHPLQRAWLDANAARAHYANNPDKPARNLGAVELSQPNSDFFI